MNLYALNPATRPVRRYAYDLEAEMQASPRPGELPSIRAGEWIEDCLGCEGDIDLRVIGGGGCELCRARAGGGGFHLLWVQSHHIRQECTGCPQGRWRRSFPEYTSGRCGDGCWGKRRNFRLRRGEVWCNCAGRDDDCCSPGLYTFYYPCPECRNLTPAHAGKQRGKCPKCRVPQVRRLVEKDCALCWVKFTGTSHQTYCGDACRRADKAAKQAEYDRAWRQANPEAYRARQRAKLLPGDPSLRSASWSVGELELVADTFLTARSVAELTGRGEAAVKRRRTLLRKKQALANA